MLVCAGACVCACVRARARRLKIVSTDKILRFTNTSIIIKTAKLFLPQQEKLTTRFCRWDAGFRKLAAPGFPNRFGEASFQTQSKAVQTLSISVWVVIQEDEMSVVWIQVVQLLLGQAAAVEDSLCLRLLRNQNQNSRC